ncbi:hypothetical protein ACT1U9_10850 [Streptomyces sp. BR1]|uniref:hypothetical protein n=1 Tax=Streptomyces sp. BR1 TaxID=1592323 RepID=UPI00402BEB2F
MTERRGSASSGDQWRETPETGRALTIRNRADAQFLAVQQQHERVVEFARVVHETGLTNLSRADVTRGTNDVEFFLFSFRRLFAVCQLIRRSALRTASLRQPIKTFEEQARAVVDVRNVLEHLDDAAIRGLGGIGYGIGSGKFLITYNGKDLDTLKLFNAAQELHAAIRAAVDPIAARDAHGQYPIIVHSSQGGGSGMASPSQ